MMRKLMSLLVVLALIAAVIGGVAWLRKPRPSVEVVSSQGNEIFHVPSCKWARKINPRYLHDYPDSRRALGHGLRPCKVCRSLMIDLPGNWQELQDDYFRVEENYERFMAASSLAACRTC